MSEFTLTKLEESQVTVISGLGDNPNTDNNLTAQQLRDKFDQGGKNIRNFLNNTLIAQVQTKIRAFDNWISGLLYDSDPAMDGTKTPGVSSKAARGDHVHPHDTSKADTGLGITGATVGKVPVISAVDGNGVPTAFAPGDGGDVTADMLGIVIDGNSTTLGASIGQYVIVKDSTITGITDGLYTAAQTIPANTAIDATYLTAVSEGGLNALEGTVKKLANVTISTLKICTSLTINADAIVFDQQYSAPSVAGYRPIGILGYNSFGNNYANVAFSRMYYNSGTGKIEWAARNTGTASASITVNVYLLYIAIV